MDDQRLLDLFQQVGVLQRGHFILSSGNHSDEYWEKFRLLEHPRQAERICQVIVERHRGQEISAVVGPTTGGALLAFEVARQIGARCVLAEPAAQGGREIRRGFALRPGEPVLIVDDVLTTGLALRETLGALAPYQTSILGIEVLIDRSGGRVAQQMPVPCRALLTVAAQTFAPESCPLCAQGVPLVKPGTRANPGA